MVAFKPAWWLANPHLQTLWPTLTKRNVSVPYTKERFNLSDGDFVELFWHGNLNGPILLLLHGLEGNAQSHYICGLAREMVKRGWRVVVMEFRGCSLEPNYLPRRYHSGDTEDLEQVLLAIHHKNPKSHLCAIGYSLGGNVLLKWLGESRYANILKAAAAVSVPFELEKIANRFEQGISRLYNYHFVRQLKNGVKKIRGLEKTSVNLSTIKHIKTLKMFDDLVTAPLHGFMNYKHYYQASSCRQFLSNINVPSLIIHAKDDPFMTPDCIPDSKELSPYVTLELHNHGGHVGFIAGSSPLSPTYWLEKRIPEYFDNF